MKQKDNIHDKIMQRLDEIFLRADTDKNKSISESEFYYAINASLNSRIPLLEAKKISKVLDTDKNGLTDLQEFKQFMYEQLKTDILSTADTANDILYLLNNYDVDGRKKMSIQEIS